MVFAWSLAIIPAAGALAQTQAVPPPTGDRAQLGTSNAPTPGSAMPGDTGRATVPGDKSSVGDSKSGTTTQKAGGTGGR